MPFWKCILIYQAKIRTRYDAGPEMACWANFWVRLQVIGGGPLPPTLNPQRKVVSLRLVR